MRVSIRFNLFCYRLLKTSRSNIFYKSFITSICLHVCFLFLSLLMPEKKMKDHFLQVNILEDSKVLSETDKREIKKAIKKYRKNQKVKKNQKIMDKFPQESFAPTQQDQEFVESLEQTLNRNQTKTKGTNYQLSKKASKRWELEKETFSQKKQKNEVAKTNIITGAIQWKHAVKRKIIHRPKVEYPSYYRQKGIQGKTRLLIKVDRSGNVITTSVISSSGHSKLDVIAQKTMRATRFSPVHGATVGYDEAEIDVHFRLTDH